LNLSRLCNLAAKSNTLGNKMVPETTNSFATRGATRGGGRQPPLLDPQGGVKKGQMEGEGAPKAHRTPKSTKCASKTPLGWEEVQNGILENFPKTPAILVAPLLATFVATR